MENGIFEEIDEEVKKEQALMFIKKHIKPICWGVAVVVILIASYSTYLSNQRRDAEVYTKRLVNVIFNYDGNLSSIEKELDYLIKNAGAKIANIANVIKLGLSGEDVSNDLIKISENKNYDEMLKDIAVLIYVSNNFDKIDSEKAIKMLEKISFANHPYKYSALELIGVIAMKNNNYDRAKDAFNTIASDENAPKLIKNRVKLLNLN